MRILVLDDDRTSANALQRLLSRSGHSPTASYSVAQAKRLCEEKTFDLMICDLQLPNENGAEMAGVAARDGIPIIAVSGLDSLTDAQPAQVRYNAFLIKPISFPTLLKTIDGIFTKPKLTSGLMG